MRPARQIPALWMILSVPTRSSLFRYRSVRFRPSSKNPSWIFAPSISSLHTACAVWRRANPVTRVTTEAIHARATVPIIKARSGAGFSVPSHLHTFASTATVLPRCAFSRLLALTSLPTASARSRRFSMVIRRTLPAVASRKPGLLRKFFVLVLSLPLRADVLVEGTRHHSQPRHNPAPLSLHRDNVALSEAKNLARIALTTELPRCGVSASHAFSYSSIKIFPPERNLCAFRPRRFSSPDKRPLRPIPLSKSPPLFPRHGTETPLVGFLLRTLPGTSQSLHLRPALAKLKRPAPLRHQSAFGTLPHLVPTALPPASPRCSLRESFRTSLFARPRPPSPRASCPAATPPSPRCSTIFPLRALPPVCRRQKSLLPPARARRRR